MLDKVVQVRVCKRSSLKSYLASVSPADESSKEALELHKQLSEVKKAIQQAKFLARWDDAQLAFELDALWHLTKDRHPLLLDKFKFRIAYFVNGNLKNFPTMGLVHLLTKSKLVRASRIFKPCIRLLTSKTTPPITDITDWSVVAACNVFREWNLIAHQFRDVIVADADSGAREVAPEFVSWVSATLIGSMLQRSSIWLERIKQDQKPSPAAAAQARPS